MPALPDSRPGNLPRPQRGGKGGIGSAPEAVRNGADINFEGAATPIDWNAAGDVTADSIAIYEYRSGAIETVVVRP